MLRELIEQIEMEKAAADEEALLEYLAFEKLAAIRAEQILEELMEKEAKGRLLSFLRGGSKTKKPLQMSFKGHTKEIQQAVKPGTKTDPRGVVSTTKWDPMTQSVQKSRHATLHTPNPQATQGVPSSWTANLKPTGRNPVQVERAQLRAAGTGY